jgi:Domain of unknown function (DUF4234)
MSEPMPEPPIAASPPTRFPGTPRSAGLNIFLAIITLGIWCWVWSYMTAEDLKRWRGQGLGGLITLLLAIVIFPVVWFTIANEVEQLYKEDGQEPPVTTLWGLWFLLPIVGAFIWYLRVQKALNAFWVSHS